MKYDPILTGMAIIVLLIIIVTLGLLFYNSNKYTVNNSKKDVVAASPNILQEQADTIILSTGEVVHRFDDVDRNNTCYLTVTSVSCVPLKGRW